jgi:hypothetical protein
MRYSYTLQNPKPELRKSLEYPKSARREPAPRARMRLSSQNSKKTKSDAGLSPGQSRLKNAKNKSKRSMDFHKHDID